MKIFVVMPNLAAKCLVTREETFQKWAIDAHIIHVGLDGLPCKVYALNDLALPQLAGQLPLRGCISRQARSGAKDEDSR